MSGQVPGARLPNFIVLGAPKCGTTSMYYYLKQHPDIFVAPKEVHFLVHDLPRYKDVVIKTWAEYEQLFDAATTPVRAEVAVRYLFGHTAIARIQERMPSAKLLTMLRDPSERAFSHVVMRFRTGGEVPASGAARPTEDDIRAAFRDMKRDFVVMGEYHRHLSRFYDAFPHDNLRVVLLQDLQRTPGAVMRELHEFLGIEPREVDASKTYNVSSRQEFNPLVVRLKRSPLLRRLRANPTARRFIGARLPRGAVDFLQWRSGDKKGAAVVRCPPDVREKLVGHYRDDISRLEELLQRDLSEWRRVEPAKAGAA